MKITKQWLRNRRACKEGLKEFNRIFPKGMRLTRANMFKAVESSGFDETDEDICLLLDIYFLVEKLINAKLISSEVIPHYLEQNELCCRRMLHAKTQKTERDIERNFQYRLADMLADDLGLK